MKIDIAYYGLEWHGLWSGTLDVFHDRFSKCLGSTNVKMVSVFPKISKLYQKMLVLYAHLFYTGHGICKEKFIYKKVVQTALNKIKKSESEWVLMVAENYLTSDFPKAKKYACYIDSDFISVAAKSSNSRMLGYNFYVKNYIRYSKESYANMDLIFTQNEWTKQAIIKEYKFASDRIFNVRFGINLEPYKGPKNYKKHLMLIVLRRTNQKVKGLDIVIKALPLIRKEIPDARLAIVGNDFYKDVDGVDTYVDFPRSKTKELFREASLYVMPSRNEPNGMTYLEALSNKTPFVALNRFAAPEFSNNGEWSFLCDTESPDELASIIVAAFKKETELETMGEKGQQFVINNYSWDKTISTMIKTMEDFKC